MLKKQDYVIINSKMAEKRRASVEREIANVQCETFESHMFKKGRCVCRTHSLNLKTKHNARSNILHTTFSLLDVRIACSRKQNVLESVAVAVVMVVPAVSNRRQLRQKRQNNLQLMKACGSEQ